MIWLILWRPILKGLGSKVFMATNVRALTGDSSMHKSVGLFVFGFLLL